MTSICCHHYLDPGPEDCALLDNVALSAEVFSLSILGWGATGPTFDIAIALALCPGLSSSGTHSFPLFSWTSPSARTSP
uniref:Uncharacterized protein n=1 Tax=Lepeophtheirus salmonis TaxID=72036 RepID=A0A0K2UFG1_LEPSM